MKKLTSESPYSSCPSQLSQETKAVVWENQRRLVIQDSRGRVTAIQCMSPPFCPFLFALWAQITVRVLTFIQTLVTSFPLHYRNARLFWNHTSTTGFFYTWLAMLPKAHISSDLRYFLCSSYIELLVLLSHKMAPKT